MCIRNELKLLHLLCWHSQWENPAALCRRLFLNATTARRHTLTLSQTQTVWRSTKLLDLLHSHAHTHSHTNASTLGDPAICWSCAQPKLAASPASLPGATIIEGRNLATAANKWLGHIRSVADLDLNIMTRMMKLTQNHLAWTESDEFIRPRLLYCISHNFNICLKHFLRTQNAPVWVCLDISKHVCKIWVQL